MFAMCAKTASNVGWFVNYLQNMEIFPTTARMSGMNITATCAVAMGITAPYVILLVGYFSALNTVVQLSACVDLESFASLTRQGKDHMQLMYLVFSLVGVVGMVASRYVITYVVPKYTYRYN